MDAGGSAADAEIDGAAPAVSQQALQLQMAFQRLEVRGGRWEGAYSGMQGMTVADFVQYGCEDGTISSAGWRFISTSGKSNQIKAPFKALFDIVVDSSRASSVLSGSSKRHISDKVLPKNPAALAEAASLANGITKYSAKDPVVRSIELACIGGDKHGKTVAVAATAPEFQLALVGVIVLLVLARRPALFLLRLPRKQIKTKTSTCARLGYT